MAYTLTDEEVDALPPIERARVYLLDYREPGAVITPLEQLELAELVINQNVSPADAADIVQARTTTREA